MMQKDEHSRNGQDPEEIATQIGLGMVYHDQRERERSIDAFATVDAFQFQHVSEATARDAAVAYVDALWAKDDIERACTVDGDIDPVALEAADWSPVREAFERRARLVGTDPEYADLSVLAWRRHKTGGDYWTPFMEAQTLELQTALQDPEYPRKPRFGQSGYGPEATRYVLGVELHDMRRFEEGIEAMTPYFRRIARGQQEESEEWTVSPP